MAKTTGDGKIFLQLTRRGAAGWAFIFCLVAVWIFSLGVLVGRGTAPVRFDINGLQQEIANLRAEMLKKEQALIKRQSKDLSAEADIEFHDRLKEKGVDTRVNFKGSAPALPEKEALRTVPVKKKSVPLPKPETLKKERVVARTPSTAVAPAPLKHKPQTSKPSTGGGYTIQVAAVKDVKTAQAAVAELQKKGYAAYAETARIANGQTWHRVRVGRFPSRRAAQSTLGRLKKQYKGALLLKQ